MCVGTIEETSLFDDTCEWCLTIDLEELLFLGAATILLFETVKAEQTGDAAKMTQKAFVVALFPSVVQRCFHVHVQGS